tara:strand:- start:85 stop:186 length:102 start_codon:yes stop_codon:yes gene_type:complete
MLELKEILVGNLSTSESAENPPTVDQVSGQVMI